MRPSCTAARQQPSKRAASSGSRGRKPRRCRQHCDWRQCFHRRKAEHWTVPCHALLSLLLSLVEFLAGSKHGSGTVPTVGRTIAVDPSVIPLGSQVIINGHVLHVRRIPVSAVKGNVIDVFVSDHATALANGVFYTEVYWAN